MAQLDIKTIRAAICRYRGGHENDTDEQIRMLWKMLPAEVQQHYLKEVKSEKGKTKGKEIDDAAGDGTK